MCGLAWRSRAMAASSDNKFGTLLGRLLVQQRGLLDKHLEPLTGKPKHEILLIYLATVSDLKDAEATVTHHDTASRQLARALLQPAWLRWSCLGRTWDRFAAPRHSRSVIHEQPIAWPLAIQTLRVGSWQVETSSATPLSVARLSLCHPRQRHAAPERQAQLVRPNSYTPSWQSDGSLRAEFSCGLC